ncbi:hypothetical protein [Jeotgalibaca porci]|uniref:hypothetical protein n=1 Tax=Jeotgalibaca porci TaxID=1868793 RepID=UPI00359F8DD6
MKKDKEWFIKELIGNEIGDYENHYNGGYEDGLAYALKLAHQLDEPEKDKLYYLKFSDNQYVQWFDEDNSDLMLVNNEFFAGLFTEEEINNINPKLMPLAVEVEE